VRTGAFLQHSFERERNDGHLAPAAGRQTQRMNIS
jgi:hypothetical protein